MKDIYIKIKCSVNKHRESLSQAEKSANFIRPLSEFWEGSPELEITSIKRMY